MVSQFVWVPGHTLYTFHLTSAVSDGGHAAWRAYKLESLQISALAPGFEWALLLHAGTQNRALYYHVAAWTSEESLDRAGVSPDMASCIARHRPYDHMITIPALREVVQVAANSANGGHAAHSALHTTFTVRAAAVDRFIEWYEVERADAAVRRMLLRVEPEGVRFYEIAARPHATAEAATPPPTALLAEAPLVQSAQILLALGI